MARNRIYHNPKLGQPFGIKVVNPTFNSPSMSVSNSVSGNKTLITSALDVTINFNWNPGSIMLEGVKQNDRAGSVSEYVVDGVSFNSEPVTKTMAIAKGSNTINAMVNYNEGPQPLNNLGEPYDSPLPAGSISKSTTVTGVLPFYTVLDENGSNDFSASLEATNFLIDTSTNSVQMVLAKEGSDTDGNPMKQRFLLANDIFASVDPITIYQFNSFTSAYDIDITSDFVPQQNQITKNIGDTGYEYIEFLNTSTFRSVPLDMKIVF